MVNRNGNAVVVVLGVLFSVIGSSLPAEDAKLVKTAKQEENFPFVRYETSDKFGRALTLYISRPATKQKEDAKLPLIVCVQGSGSQSIFQEVETPRGKRIASGGPEAVIRRDFGSLARVLVVEKPGVEFLKQPKRPGSAEEASDEFKQEHTLERWSVAVATATKAAMKLPGVDAKRVLVLGHSEGGQIACEVAARVPAVTHVAVMAGGGPTQLFDLIKLARDGKFYNSDPDPETRVKHLLEEWEKVLESPDAYDKLFLGHPYRRWTSFLASSPIESILRSNAKVFIAQGLADTNSEPLSADVLYAELRARGRQCTYLRIPDANHGFMQPDDKAGKGWQETNARAVQWFLESADET